MAMGAMAALHGLAWCLGSLQKLPQSCRAVRTGLKDNPLCYCEARMWLIAIRIHIFPPCVKSLYVSYNHHFWASSQPQNRFSFTISGSHLANIPMKVESSKSTPFSRHVVILLFCTKHGSWSVLSRGITYLMRLDCPQAAYLGLLLHHWTYLLCQSQMHSVGEVMLPLILKHFFIRLHVCSFAASHGITSIFFI